MSFQRDNRVLLTASAGLLAALLLYALPLVRPLLLQDDIQILARSVTWQSVQDHLWQPHNEHVMPLGRVSTWLLIQLAGRPTMLPFAATLQGVLALLAGMVFVYLFVRRELGHSFYGLTALALFGVSTVYQQAVFWFAASFAVLALDTLLLALLAAQHWRQTGRRRYLALCVVACALAPAWFASGILAGPLCCLYLLPASAKPRRDSGARTSALRYRVAASLPLLGTLLFLLVSLPRSADHIMHLEHYGKKTAVESFHPLVGLLCTGQSLVENLMLGQLGLGGIDLPAVVIVPALIVLAAVGFWWWRGAPDRRLLLLGLGMILGSYWLVYSARADWHLQGVRMNQPGWSRYHLLPQLGLTLFICGGLPRWQLDPSGLLSPRQVKGLLILILGLFLLQLPRGILVHWPDTMSPQEQLALLRSDPSAWWRRTCEDWRTDAGRTEQRAVLRRIEEVDALCRQHRIAAATAREALGKLSVPSCASEENGWNLLRGSDDPLPHTVEEARQLLGG